MEEGANNDTVCGQSVNVPKAARAASLLEVASVPSRCVASTEVILLCWLLVILNCALTICGKENLLCKACVFRFATRPFSLTFQRTLSAKLSARLQLGLGKDGKAGVPAGVRGKKAHEIKSDRK